jgi:hypothetical protein
MLTLEAILVYLGRPLWPDLRHKTRPTILNLGGLGRHLQSRTDSMSVSAFSVIVGLHF